jgi:predicted sulfurtransferase
MRDWKPELFGNVDFKFTDGLPIGQLFPALKVFPVTELVNYGLAGKQPQLKNGGVHLEAAEYHKKMEEPNTVIIDVRNSYEAEIGRFQPPQGGAEYIDPKMRVSTEFPGWVDKNKEKLKGKQIMMYCTGGIRCERASALLREKGLDNIYQMQGGIHRYLESYAEDGGYWIGKNYTFDKRFAHGAANSEVVGKCVSCKESFEKYRGKKRCPACGVPLLICEACQAKKLELKSVCALCEEQGKRPEQKQRKKRDGNGQSCAMCLEEFKTRNALFRHLKETGHMNRPRKNK